MADELIMVIDDDRSIREALADVLVDEGYQVVTAGNGAEALTYLDSGAPRPQLLLLDVMMPVMDGAEFRRRQMASTALATIPTIVLSADACSTERADWLGAADYLRKPIDLDVLCTAVASHRAKHY